MGEFEKPKSIGRRLCWLALKTIIRKANKINQIFDQLCYREKNQTGFGFLCYSWNINQPLWKEP